MANAKNLNTQLQGYLKVNNYHTSVAILENGTIANNQLCLKEINI